MVASLQSKEGDMPKQLYHVQLKTPYTALYLAFGLSPLSVRKIRTVIALLHPGDEREDVFNRRRPQG
jgi:hypothetical protein